MSEQAPPHRKSAPGIEASRSDATAIRPVHVPARDQRQADFKDSVAAARSNHVGLPERLKAGIEALSGFSMEDVRVHYGSLKPARLGALAFAQGSDIHVAAGQERHLPHEAWHVVQQKQGRVRPTQRVAGVGVNGDDALEREADVKGSLALAAGAGTALPGSAARGGSPATVRGTVQRVLAQVISDDDGRIDAVVIVGRPRESLFSGSMGAHTTAWAVHVDAVKEAVVGKSYQEAWAALKLLFQGAGDLPGAKLAGDPRLAPARATLAGTLSRDIAREPHKGLVVQKAIREYLDFRDLIALSAVNVRFIGGSVGGLGEAAPLAVLRDSERNAKAGGQVDTHRVIAAVMALIDAETVIRVAVEGNADILAALSPGMPAALPPPVRIAFFVDQHLKTLAGAYPRSIRQVASMDTFAWSRHFLATHRAAILKRLHLDLSEVRKRILALHEQAARHMMDLALQRTSRRRTAKSALFAPMTQMDSLATQRAHILSLLVEFGGPQGPAATDLHSGMPPAAVQGSVSSGAQLPPATRESLAVEVQLDGDQISHMIAEGRPDSPHDSGRMGAHTTAWAVRVDAIAAALTKPGKTLANAAAALRAITSRAEDANERLLPTFALTPLQAAKLAEARVRLGRSLDALAARATVSALQVAIRDLLAFMNLSPGASRDEVDTGGKAEGKSRGILRNPAEKGTAAVKAAIAGLLDVGRDDPGFAKLALEHLIYVQEAYPDAYLMTGWPLPADFLASGLPSRAVLTALAARVRDPDPAYRRSPKARAVRGKAGYKGPKGPKGAARRGRRAGN